MKKFEFNERRLKYGTLATVITVIFIAVVVLANILVSMLLDRFPAKIDLTQGGTFEISEESINFLKTVEMPVAITVLQEELTLKASGIDGQQVCEVINRYAQYSKNITVKYINPEKNPSEVSRLNFLYKGDISNKLVTIEAGERVKVLAQTDLVVYNQTSFTEYEISSTAEQAMTSALMAVTDANPIKVTILTDDDSIAINGLTDMLGLNGYDVETVDPLTGVIDPKSSMLIVNAPLNDYSDDQIKKMEDFLNNDGKMGKNLLYVSSLNQKLTPKIDSFLASYGVQIDTGCIMESDMNNMTQVANGVYGVYTKIDNENFVKDVEQPLNPVVATYSRPINLLFAEKDGIKTESLLATNDTAYIIPLDAAEDLDISKLPQSSSNIITLSTKTTFDSENNKATTNVLTVGSPWLLNSSFISNSNWNNGDYLLSISNTLTGKSAGISIVPKDLNTKKVDISQADGYFVRNIVCIFIPLAIVIVGIVIYVRRRNR